MLFPEPKNVFFVENLLHPNFSLSSSGLPYFYSVKLDVIGFGKKAHFWNWETSYIKVLYMIFHELDDVHLRFFKMTRATYRVKQVVMHLSCVKWFIISYILTEIFDVYRWGRVKNQYAVVLAAFFSL